MEKITSIEELKLAIQELEVKRSIQGELLKEQFYRTYDSLKPVNLLKNTIKDLTTSTDLTSDILGTVTGLVSGYFSKKIVVGTSGGSLRKLLGAVVQVGITNFVSRNPENIRSFGQFILQQFLHKKETKSD
jgi:hypothetical protein